MSHSKTADFQRSNDAPPLPPTTFRFITYLSARFRGWFLLMMVLETGQAASNILLPYAIGQIIDGVTHSGGD